VYKSLGEALRRKLLTESDLDVAVRRLMLARLRLGLFDPPERVRYAQIPYAAQRFPEARSARAAHGRRRRSSAQERQPAAALAEHPAIAVVGPNADEVMTLVGNYYGTPSEARHGARRDPSRRQSLDEGALRSGRRPGRGAARIRGRPPIPSTCLRPSAGSSERGLRGEYFKGRELSARPC